MTWLGLDIGGANIKAATSDGRTLSVPFRFWIEHERLGEVLTEIIRALKKPGVLYVAATMTAELADCFESRQEGVERIVDCLEKVCAEMGLRFPIFANTNSKYEMASEAKKYWLKTAASNWATLAKYASRFLPESTGIVIDMGSTTTDIIPVRDGDVVSKGKTDSQRLQHGELVYIGVDRTPVCAVVHELMLDGMPTPIAREFFATVGDAMLLSGYVDPDANCRDTADGRPRTINDASRRLCKMICEDSNHIGLQGARNLAAQILDRIEILFAKGIDLHSSKPENFIVTGSGANFAKRMVEKQYPNAKVETLGSFVDTEMNHVAPAWALAVLACERNTR
jgi:probable H4MPT-linked C1 transfer pathway protein